MTKASLTFIALPCKSPSMAVAMYSSILGVTFKEESHGGGPIHYAAELDGGVVLEIYDSKHLSKPVIGCSSDDDTSIGRIDLEEFALRVSKRAL